MIRDALTFLVENEPTIVKELSSHFDLYKITDNTDRTDIACNYIDDLLYSSNDLYLDPEDRMDIMSSREFRMFLNNLLHTIQGGNRGTKDQVH